MNISELFANKEIKPKEKTESISKWLLKNEISLDELIGFACASKDSIKATCIEAIEFTTKLKPEFADEICFTFVSKTLCDNAPRIKWESARVIGNIAHLFPAKLDNTVKNLLENSKHPGTVVRWSAAFALVQILKLKTKLNADLLPTIEKICEKEEKNSIKKIYLDAIKKIKK